MTLVARTTESGLVLAEQAQDEARLCRALKEIDDRYVLQANPSEETGQLIYEVLCVWSEDHPPVKVMAWTDRHGNPLPLSSGLIEEVKKWRPEARERRGADADAHNDRLRADTDRLRRTNLEAISDDHRAKVERARVTVSLGAGTSKPERMRNKRPPSSGLA